MNRGFCLLFVCLLALAPLSTGGIAANTTQETYLTVADTTITPNPPEPDEEFTVVAAIRNLENSSESYKIDRVELRGGPDQNFTLHDDTSPPGIVRSGEQKYVRLTGSIEDSGTHSLRLHVYGTDDDGERIHFQYDTEVRVGAERPQLSLDSGEAIAKTDSTVNVTVANGLPSDARNVRVSVDGDGLDFENPRRVRSALASGKESTFQFTVSADQPGTHRITAELRYTTANGTTQTVTQHTDTDFDSLSNRVSLTAQSAAEGSAVAATITNYGNVPLSNVVVRADSPNATLSDAPATDLDPGESRTVELNITQFDADGSIPVTAVATYEAGNTQGQTNASVEITSNPGAIRLTGLELEPEDGAVHLSGSASNVGLTEANSVIVSVVSTDGVDPAQPNKEYFAGTVPASDFVSFDVFAEVDEGVSEIPLEVTYLVDGERRTYTVSVEYDGARPSAATGTESETDSILFPAVAGGFVVLAVGGLMFVGWRNSRDGT